MSISVKLLALKSQKKNYQSTFSSIVS